MKPWLLVVLLLVARVLPVQAANTHGLPSALQEQRAWWGEAMQGYVVSGCAGVSNGGGATARTFATCKAYVLNTATPYQLEYVDDSTSRIVDFSGGDGTYWLILHASTLESVGGWTRSPANSPYLWQKVTDQPVLPSRATWVGKYTVASAAISDSIDLRASNPFNANILRVTDPLWGAMPNDGADDATAINAAMVAARRGNVVIDFPPGIYNVTGTSSATVQALYGTQTSIAIVGATDVLVRGEKATLRAGSTSVRLLGVYDSTRVRVTGLSLMGHTQTISEHKHAIVVGHNSHDVEIDHNYCTNFLGDCFYVGGNLSDGTLTGFTSTNIHIHHNTFKERYGNGTTSVSGGTHSRLAGAIVDARYVTVENNLIYGVVGVEPDVNNQYSYHIKVRDNDFHSGPVTAQATIGTTYHHDEPIVAPGGAGTNIDGGLYFAGNPGAPLIGEVSFTNNDFERGTINCSVAPYECVIKGNKFNEGLITVSFTSGTGTISFAHVEGNETKFPYPGQTTFIKLAGLGTFGTFVNNFASIAGGYVIDDAGGASGDNGRNYFVGNANRSATAAGSLGFTPQPTSVAANNWHNASAPLETLVGTGASSNRGWDSPPRTITVQTDCSINAGEYICDFRPLANDNWILTANAPVSIKQIANMPPGRRLLLRHDGGANAITLVNSTDIRIAADTNRVMASIEDTALFVGVSATQIFEIAQPVDE